MRRADGGLWIEGRLQSWDWGFIADVIADWGIDGDRDAIVDKSEIGRSDIRTQSTLRRPRNANSEMIPSRTFTTASPNPRSLRAHARVGFQTLEIYADPDTGEGWNVIALDFAECLARGRPDPRVL